MTTQTMFDEAKRDAFVGKALNDSAGLAATLLSIIGDHLDLFKDLAAKGPATSAEFATRTGLNERYLREWLSGTAAGYIEYDPEDRPFLASSRACAGASAGDRSDVLWRNVPGDRRR